MVADLFTGPASGSPTASASSVGSWEKETQRYFADNYVKSAINEVGITSGDKYYSWMRDQGLSVTRDVARTAWKEYGTATQWRDVINVWGANRAIPRAWYAETDAKGAQRYNYKVSYNIVFADTGDSETRTYLKTSNVPMTLEQIGDAINDMLERSAPGMYSGASGFTMETAYHKEGDRW